MREARRRHAALTSFGVTTVRTARAIACSALVGAACILSLATTTRAQRVTPPLTGSSLRGLDVVHYEFSVVFPASGRADTIAVSEVIMVRRTSRSDTLVLDLAPAMIVSEASIAGRGTPFVRDGATVRIPLPAGSGDSLRVGVKLMGVPKDGLVVRRDSVLGTWTAFADHFPNRAREWLATVDHPSDKATVEWIVRAPTTHRVIGNGNLLEETPVYPLTSGSVPMTLTRWRTVRPIYTAVMVIGVAPFSVFELGSAACGKAELPGCVRQSVWVSPDVRPSMPGAFARANDMVDLFTRLAGPYPYEKLAHVQSSTRYGGMENASAIFYSDAAFRRGTISESLVAHETAHQWFGDAITTREWPHVWLSEGFATYFAELWDEHAHGDSAFLAGMRRVRENVLKSVITVEKPVVDTLLDDVGRVLNSNVYQKAGFTLHMLRRQVGDSAFFRGVRAFYAKHRHGNALTDDFMREVELASAQKLGWFFDQWMRRPGYAELTVTQRHDKARNAIILDVVQGTRFAPYRLRMSVDVTDAQGRTRRGWVDIPATRQASVRVPLLISGTPDRVVLDAGVSVLGTVTLQ
ncbi:MAG: M1 family metallopeptidase [Gemmatimonas sp.]